MKMMEGREPLVPVAAVWALATTPSSKLTTSRLGRNGLEIIIGPLQTGLW
jgi:hypothetical protein